MNHTIEFFAYFLLFALCFWCVGCVPTDEVKEDSIQHMFDKCIEDSSIAECRVLVEFKRSGGD